MQSAVAPLRVAVVTDGLYPYFKGGKEVRHHELLRRAAGPGIVIEVCTMAWWDGPRSRHDHGITYRALCAAHPMYVGTRRSIPQALWFAVGSLRLVETRSDVIDADHMPYLHLLPLRLVTWLRRIPLVVTWHEWWGRDYWVSYLGPLGRFAAIIERWVVRCADLLVVETEDTAARLEAAGIARSKIAVLPLGVDGAAIDRAAPAAEGYDVLYAGRLLAHKRVDVILGALQRLGRHGLRPTCAIVGAGPEEQRLRRLVAELCLVDQVTFREPVREQAELFGLMKSARVFAYPSEREGFGLAVLEALACGTPVVTSDHRDNHARHFLLEKSAGVACASDPDSFAAALRSVLGAAPHSGPLVDVGQWDWQRRADDLLDLYRREVATR